MKEGVYRLRCLHGVDEVMKRLRFREVDEMTLVYTRWPATPLIVVSGERFTLRYRGMLDGTVRAHPDGGSELEVHLQPTLALFLPFLAATIALGTATFIAIAYALMGRSCLLPLLSATGCVSCAFIASLLYRDGSSAPMRELQRLLDAGPPVLVTDR